MTYFNSMRKIEWNKIQNLCNLRGINMINLVFV